jgi:acyl carrier protein
MRDNIKEKILEIIKSNIEDTEITHEQYEDDLSAMGLDSINFIRMIVTLEETFDIEVPDEKLLITEMNTVSKIENIISFLVEGKNKYNNDE